MIPDGVAECIYCILNKQKKSDDFSFHLQAVLLCRLSINTYGVYCAYALYLVVYLYPHLAEQVQP